MLALLCLFLLFSSGDAFHIQHSRNDEVGSISPEAKTHMGEWGVAEYCYDGSYAYGFKMNVGNTGETDDTGVNALVLFCKNRVRGKYTNQAASKYKNWGTWGDTLKCSGQSFLTGVSMKSQSKKIFGDDTAANNFKFTCQDGKDVTGSGGSHGTWSSQVNCPANSAICGIKTRVEDYGRYFWNDNTSLNEAIFYCCSI